MRGTIEQGRTLTDCLKGRKYFPQTMIDMCAVGEETGELEDTLENVADYYTNEADFRIQRLLAHAGANAVDPAFHLCGIHCGVDLPSDFHHV